jgi:putative ABC transport system ATP-binding protein
MKLLRGLLREGGKTAVVVTHDTRIFEFADRICVIDKGVLTERRISPNQMTSKT